VYLPVHGLANGHPLGFLTPYRQNDATYAQSKLP
jgi:hypothetical protein